MKKILVFSHNCFSSTANNGKTLVAMLSGIHPSNISQVFISTNDTPLPWNNVSYFLISDLELIKSTVTGCSFGRKVIPTYKNTRENPFKLARYDGSTKKIKKNSFTILLRELVWSVLFPLKKNTLFGWINSVKPDILLYVSGDAVFSQRIALEISNAFSLPLITFITDDYLVNNKPKALELFKRLHFTLLFKSFTRLIAKTKKCLVISEKMKSVYDAAFGTNALVFSNTIDKRPFNVKNHIEGEKIKLGYFGNLSLGREEQLVNLASFISSLPNVKHNAEIYIHTFSKISQNQREKFGKYGIIVCPGVEEELLSDRIYSCDILLLVESSKPKHKQLTELSFSTKIPEYLMHCRPILAFGPSSVGSMYFVKQYGCGVQIDPEDYNENDLKTLQELLSNWSFRSEIAKKSYAIGNEYFSKEAQTNRFYDLIQSL